jgi:unsaturated chondroitin disaccharide hydrolase
MLGFAHGYEISEEPRLARWPPDRAERYRSVGQTLTALLSNFPTPGGGVLHGSWGRMRHMEKDNPLSTGSPRKTPCPRV